MTVRRSSVRISCTAASGTLTTVKILTNLGCYLSATLQLLYNVQWLRERIFRVPEQDSSDFLKELQRLFALMCKGSLIYVDPTELFEVLKKMHPGVFIVGSQNDFH